MTTTPRDTMVKLKAKHLLQQEEAMKFAVQQVGKRLALRFGLQGMLVGFILGSCLGAVLTKLLFF